MSGLNLLILTDDGERFRGALMLAMTHAARGGMARLFLQLDAVRLLLAPHGPRDTAHRAAGLLCLHDLLDEALDSGVAITACQTGLELWKGRADDLDPRIATGGLMSFLTGLPQKELLQPV